MQQQETYKYNLDFQVRVAAMVMRDPAFLSHYEDVINPDYFDYSYLSHIVRLAKKHKEKTGDLPSKTVFVQEVDDFCKSFRIAESDHRHIMGAIERIYRLDLIDSNAIKDAVVKFGQRQAMKGAVMQLADMLETDADYDKSVDLIENALRVGYDVNNLGTELFSNLTRLPELVRRDGLGFAHKVKTMFPIFDQKTMGGPGRGELWTVLGMSGGGKSQYLVNMGAAAIQQNVHVVHITVGDLDEEDVLLRYGSRLTLVTQEEILSEDPEYMKRAERLAENKDQYLRVKYYDPGTVTVGHIKAYISKLITVERVNPGLLILDYPDEFKMPFPNDTYQSMGVIYSEIKAILKQFNMVGWAGSQIHRWAPKTNNDVIQINNIADSAKKIFKADGVVSVNQTYEESEYGKARLWVDKVRRGKCYFLVPLDVDYSRSLMQQGTLLEAA